MRQGSELLARIKTVGLLGGVLFAIVAGWLWSRRTVTLHARIPERGGWLPAELVAQVGQPLRLRLTSEDVLHGFAIGQSNIPAVDVKPGEITEVTLTFERPGRYTFYCTRWCGVNHWRMRGVIEVSGAEVASTAIAEPPLYLRLGLDLEAKPHADVLPARRPSTVRGASLAALLPRLARYSSEEHLRTHSLLQTWQALRLEPSLQYLTDQDLWDLVAYLWQVNASPEALAEARQLYAANCAACHGEKGKGDGIYAAQLTEQIGSVEEAHSHDPSTTIRVEPTDFTDPTLMLAANPARLQGKIVRGGMGTGMPSWGPIFTEEQTWALVHYLYTFLFEEALP